MRDCFRSDLHSHFEGRGQESRFGTQGGIVQYDLGLDASQRRPPIRRKGDRVVFMLFSLDLEQYLPIPLQPVTSRCTNEDAEQI